MQNCIILSVGRKYQGQTCSSIQLRDNVDVMFICMSNFIEFQIIFKAMVNSYPGYIALDDILVDYGECNNPGKFLIGNNFRVYLYINNL